MAKTSKPSPDRFHVGQHVIIMDLRSKRAFWKSINGSRGVITGPPEMRHVSVEGPDGRPTGAMRYEKRYEVRCSALRAGLADLHESQLRPVASDELSTWDEFRKATGISLVETITVRPVKKARRREGASHG